MIRPGRLLRPFGLAVAVLLVAGVAACSRAPDPGPAPAPPAANPIVIRVYNKYWADVNVSVDIGGQRARLGVVTAVASGSFQLPERLLIPGRPFRLIADPIGPTITLSSETVYVRPGQLVEWTLESDLRRSTVTVF
jgi:hypothetical protein